MSRLQDSDERIGVRTDTRDTNSGNNLAVDDRSWAEAAGKTSPESKQAEVATQDHDEQVSQPPFSKLEQQATTDISDNVPISDEAIAARTSENRINLADNVPGVIYTESFGGYLDIVMHGDATGTQANINGYSIDFSLEQTARLVEASPSWEHRSIRLLSCSTGHSDYAQDLADRLEVPVYAPTGVLHVYPDGSSEVTGPGGWKRFEPTRN